MSRRRRILGACLVAALLGGCDGGAIPGQAPAPPIVAREAPSGDRDASVEPSLAMNGAAEMADPAPGEKGARAEATPAAPTDAKIAQHVRELEAALPRGFHVAVERPFVVIGNQSRDQVRRHASGTVRYANRHLKREYFSRDPEEIIDVWLFADPPSYRRYSRELFGYEPDTPYGFFLEEENALIMNITTGGGTLVHEIVHPYMKANFPGCPPWFNEGLASLYECSTLRGGRIVGVVNWRLAGLKRAIARGELPSFEALMAEDAERFYGESSGDNYAQARYLLLYLQEKGLLGRFYREFCAAAGSDPTGYATLQGVLGTEEMAAFERRWRRWVARLEP